MPIIRPRWRRASRFLARAATVWCTLSLVYGLHAAIDSQDAGAVTPGAAQVVASNGEPLAGGGSDTLFELDLPDGAACSGDTASDNYKVQSYMVPTTTAPHDLAFDNTGLVAQSFGTYSTFRQPLFDEFQTQFVNASTAAESGAVIDLPNFNFTVWSPGNVPPGSYNVGIACNLGVQPFTLDKFWNVTIQVVEDTTDPAGISFSVQQAAPTTLSLAVTPASPSDEDETVTLTATVAPAAAAGSVTFFDDGVQIGNPVAVAGGSASLQTSTLTPGSRQFTATFAPTDLLVYAPSSAPAVAYEILAVGPATATLALSADPASTAPQNTPVTFTATIQPSAAAGTVQFLVDNTPAGSPVTVTGGTAAHTTSSLAVGARTVKATFTPTNAQQFTSATAEAIYTITAVAAKTTSLSLAANPASKADEGSKVTLTATVIPSDAVGAVTFSAKGTALAAAVPVSAGAASLETTKLPPGDIELKATFVPTDATKFAGSSSTLAYKVTPKDGEKTTISLTINPATQAAPGQEVTLTAKVEPAAAAGTVTFSDKDAKLGDAVTVANGVATFKTDDLAAGEHTLKAAFAPTDTKAYQSSTSLAVTFKVAGTTTTTTTVAGSTTGAGASVESSTQPLGGEAVSPVGTGDMLPLTGGGSLPLAVWAVLMVVFGRVALLLGRTPAVVPARRR